jgi:hypothetical protein
LKKQVKICKATTGKMLPGKDTNKDEVLIMANAKT